MDPKIAVMLRFFPLLSSLASSAPILDARTNAALAGQKASEHLRDCLLYTSPSPRDGLLSRMPSSA